MNDKMKGEKKKMVGFITEDGERYHVDTARRHITGGAFKALDDAVLYESLTCIIGMPAVVIRSGGERVELPKVERYLTLRNI